MSLENNMQSAIIHYKKAIELAPTYESYFNSLAWFYATCKDESFRNYPEAVRLAEQSVGIRATHYNLDTLVVAYERNGQTAEAVKTQQRFIENWKKTHPGKKTRPNHQKRLTRLENQLN